MNKEICIISPEIFTEIIGGAEKQALLIAKELVKRSWKVSYIRENDQKLGCVEQIEDIRVYALPLRHTKLRWLNLFHLFRLMNYIKAGYWYCRGTRSYLFTVWCISILVGGNVIWACSNDSQVTKSMKKTKERRSFIFELFFFIDKWLFIFALKSINCIILQNRIQKILLKRNWGIHGEIVYNSIPFDRMSSKERKKNILWIGRFQTHKRPEKFIDIAKKMKGTEVKCFMVGGGANKDIYLDKIKKEMETNNNFSYLGELENEEVIYRLSESQLLISTAEYEGFPNIFLEAWSCGVPVLTLNIDPDNVIKKKQLGRVSISLDDMIKNINELIQDNEEWTQLSHNARMFVFENFRIENNIDRLEDILGSK